jgi:heavy metal sensor kinase
MADHGLVRRRFPIRVRLTLAFALVMALVLAGAGAFVYLRLGAELDRAVDQGLRSRAAALATVARSADRSLADSGSLAQRGESVAQILTSRGRVVGSAPERASGPLLSASELRRARRGAMTVEHRSVPGVEGRTRLRAAPVRAGDRELVVVAGASVDDRDEALQSLLVLLLIGGGVALALASLAGYGLAAAALRPVEAMRGEAAAVSVSEPGRRLPVPDTGDEIARLGETLNQMLARQEGALARERTFLSDASHELRTPLAILRTELELALRGGRSPEELEQAVRSAAEETDRLSQLAQDLLVIARSDQGRLPVRPTEVDAAELLGSVRERFARRAAEQGRSIRVESETGARLVADPPRLEQALGNLVENALRHGAGDIELAAEARDGAVELHVRDAGEGFPPDFLASAFERFTRGDPARSRGGTGLGLAIVEAIARAHGAAAGARNRPPGGADVWIRLPS